MVKVKSDEFNPVSYLDTEIKFIIHDFSLTKPLKKGKDVNKYVVNVGKDEHMQLGIAHFIHQTKVKAGNSISIDDFLKNECNLSIGTEYDSFIKVFYGDNPLPEVSIARLKCRDDSHKMPELVTCILDDSYDKRNLNKGTKKRVSKKELKEEDIKGDQIILKEEDPTLEEKENVKPVPNRSKRSKKSRKTPVLKPKVAPEEEINATIKEVKVEKDFTSTIEKILEYSKKPKSAPDMDFSDDIQSKTIKKPSVPKSRKKRQTQMSRFKEYMEWYDLKTQSGKSSVQSKMLNTPLSTPAKISLRISQRLARSQRVK
jgi:hypothetical protein